MKRFNQIVLVLMLLFVHSYAVGQNITVKTDSFFKKIKKDRFEAYVDITNEQSLIIQRDENNKLYLIGLYGRTDVDSICSELTYPTILSDASYFFFKNGKISRFVSEKTDEYFVIIDDDGKNSTYHFYRGKNDIYGLVLYARNRKVTKIILSNPEQNNRRK